MQKFPLVLLAVLAISAAPAEAAKPAIIGWGEKISEISELPKEMGTSDQYKVGLYYNSFRIFFIPVITWGQKYVVFSEAEHAYDDIPAEGLAMLEEKLGKLDSKGGFGSMWVRYVNWLWPVLIGLFIARKVIGGRKAQTPFPAA